MENNEVRNFSFVMGCLHRLNIIIDEFETIYTPRKGEREFLFVSRQIFKIYHMGLMYIFVCEYCKLLEMSGRRGSNNASLAKLNKKIKNTVNGYQNYDEVAERIEKLDNSDFHKNIRTLRDSNFAHMDSKGKPYSVKSFEDDEFDTAKKHVKEMIEILNLCGSGVGTHYHIETNVQYGKNFIDEFSKFQETRDERVERIMKKYKGNAG